MRLNRILTATTFVLIFTPALSQAQIYECNGRWTNQPCSGTPGRTIFEQKTETNDHEDHDLSSKRSALHELTMKAIEAREELGLRYETNDISRSCLKSTTSYEDCSAKIKAASNELEEQIIARREILTKEKELKIKEESLKRKEEKKSEGVSVNIINPNPYYNGGYRPTYYPTPYNTPYPPTPYPTPPPKINPKDNGPEYDWFNNPTEKPRPRSR